MNDNSGPRCAPTALNYAPIYSLMALTQKICASLNIPVMVKIRPRAGNFIYSGDEIVQMQQEIKQAKKAGAAGIVFGMLTPDKNIDVANTQKLADEALPLPVTFHKAIDEADDLPGAVTVLKKIKGITRILTSGGRPTAKEGAAAIREMKKAAGGFPGIMAAGKVTADNVNEIARLTGAQEFHGRQITGNLTRHLP